MGLIGIEKVNGIQEGLSKDRIKYVKIGIKKKTKKKNKDTLIDTFVVLARDLSVEYFGG